MKRVFNRNCVVLSCVAAALLGSGCTLDRPTVHVDSIAALRQAIANAPATGQTIVLAPGRYRQVRQIIIHDRDRLTVTGSTDDFNDTVISGPGINDQRVRSNIVVDASKHVTIAHMTLENTAYHGVQVDHDSDNFVARNLKTWDNGESGFKVTSPSYARGDESYSDDGLIENCLIGFSGTGQRSVVEGIDIVGGNGWVIRGNRLENILKANGHAAYAVFAKGNASGTVIENNQVFNSSVGLSFGGGGTGAKFFRDGDTTYETRGGVIRGNRVYGTHDTGIYLNKAHDFKVHDNIVINARRDSTAIAVRYPQSRGRIYSNTVNARILRRDGARASIFRNETVAESPAHPRSAHRMID
ncbi:right-handed parallel beta-helix repeat-containing protein [Salinisphaera sp. T31B1]|uniref:right-handed parallel beta-helix repeat-containing protein n=1 Tax=Salinisphaera sp. T31B1 TaxID=727963 RepID=UPI0033406F0D